MKTFLEFLRLGEREKGKMILNAFIDLVVSRGKKGIWNKDESFLRNYGLMDSGGTRSTSAAFTTKKTASASIRDTMHPVRTWLEKTDPEMLEHFDRVLEEKIATVFSTK